MRVSGRRGHTREVPGTCNIGKMGVTFDYPQVRGPTLASARRPLTASVISCDGVHTHTILRVLTKTPSLILHKNKNLPVGD